MKRPAFQFYPSDWRKDAALQSCSIAARGLWLEMMCIAHECEPYGHLTINGRAMTASQIFRLVGIGERDGSKMIEELSEAGVLSVSENGSYFSRRMVRDEDLRARRADGGKAGSEFGKKGAEFGLKGGRPPVERGDKKPPLKPPLPPPLKPPPSSSSSSSSSPSGEEPHSPIAATLSLVDRLWEISPRLAKSRSSKPQCLKALTASKPRPDDDTITNALSAWCQSDEWTKEGGQFAPALHRWIQNRKWEFIPDKAKPQAGKFKGSSEQLEIPDA